MENGGKRFYRVTVSALLIVLTSSPAIAATTPYPMMAPIGKYLSASDAGEIALARSAAPPSIAKDAEVRTLGPHGYDVYVKGTNGFVCIVARAWAGPFNGPDFWNPKVRAPLCLNPPAVRSILPEMLLRTKWVLSGASEAQVIERAKGAVASKAIKVPEVGAMCYMTSKHGYLGDDVRGPWHPHLMFFLPRTAAAQWGANEADSFVFASTNDIEQTTTFLVPIANWSDGTIASEGGRHHH